MTTNRVRTLSVSQKLAKTPLGPPRYARQVQNIKGEKEQLADPRATRALVALMSQHAVIGGAAAHWGGPAAFAEIMSSLHAIMFRNKDKQWFENFNFINDAGHTENGIYALRSLYGFDGLTFESLRGFRSIESKLTGHGEAHLNPEGVYISNGPLGSGISQAQGLAMADKLQGNERVTICTISDGASMEGEAKEALCSIPGMATHKKINPFVLIISDNDTKLSGRIGDDSFSMAPYFNSLEAQGWEMVKLENGHDLQRVHQTIDKAIETAKSSEKPICIWAKTIKGYGVKSTVENKAGGHGYPLKPFDPELINFVQEIYENQAPEEFLNWAEEILSQKDKQKSSKPSTDVKMEKVQPGFARAAIKAVQNSLPVVSLSADLQGSTGIAPFHKEYPELSYDFGVAEANMIGSAIGFSKKGYIPIVDTFAQFGVTKGNLPLIMASLSQGPVIALFSHTGFQDAADGASHQATSYLAAVSSIPHTQVVCCSCSQEAEALMTQAISHFQEKREKGETPDSILFFFGRENHPEYYRNDIKYEWGKGQLIREGEDATLVTTGPMLNHALEAADEIEKIGKSMAVINTPFINKPDTETIKDSLKKTNGRLITLEDHQMVGGMGAQLVHALVNQQISFHLETVANKGHFGQSAYKASQLYKKFKMDKTAIIEAFKRIESY